MKHNVEEQVKAHAAEMRKHLLDKYGEEKGFFAVEGTASYAGLLGMKALLRHAPDSVQVMHELMMQQVIASLKSMVCLALRGDLEAMTDAEIEAHSEVLINEVYEMFATADATFKKIAEEMQAARSRIIVPGV